MGRMCWPVLALLASSPGLALAVDLEAGPDGGMFAPQSWEVDARTARSFTLTNPARWVVVENESLAAAEIVDAFQVEVRAGTFGGRTTVFVQYTDGSSERFPLHVRAVERARRAGADATTQDAAVPDAGPLDFTFASQFSALSGGAMSHAQSLSLSYRERDDVAVTAQGAVRGSHTQPLQRATGSLNTTLPWGGFSLGSLSFGVGRAWSTGLTGLDVHVDVDDGLSLGLTMGVAPPLACCRVVGPESPTVVAARAAYTAPQWRGHLGAGLVDDPRYKTPLPVATVGADMDRDHLQAYVEGYLAGEGGGMDLGFTARPVARFTTAGTMSMRSGALYAPVDLIQQRADRLTMSVRQLWTPDDRTQISASTTYGTSSQDAYTNNAETWVGGSVFRALTRAWSGGVGYAHARRVTRSPDGDANSTSHSINLSTAIAGKHAQALTGALWLVPPSVDLTNPGQSSQLQLRYQLKSRWDQRFSTNLSGQVRARFDDERTDLVLSSGAQYATDHFQASAGALAVFRPTRDGLLGEEQVRASLGWMPTGPHRFTVDGTVRIVNAAWRIDRQLSTNWNAGLGYQYQFGRRRIRPRRVEVARGPQVQGVAFLDRDLDGTRDPDEPPLPGLTVLVNGAPAAVTDAEGRYHVDLGFGPAMLDAENYNVTGGPHELVVARIDDALVHDLPCAPGARLIVRAFEDTNGDRRFDPGDLPLRDAIRVPIWVDGTAYRVLVTGTRDIASFPPGTHQVKVDLASLPPALVFAGESPEFEITVAPFTPTVVDVPLRSDRRLRGTVRRDTDGDGEITEADEPAAGVRVRAGPGRETLTDADGAWAFARVPSGQYEVLVDGAAGPLLIDARGTRRVDFVADALVPAVMDGEAVAPATLETSPTGALVLDVGKSAPLEAYALSGEGARTRAWVQWEVEDAMIATVDASSRLTGTRIGQTRVRARSGEVTSPWLAVEVRQGALVALAIVERAARVAIGEPKPLTARAIQVDGKMLDLRVGVAWTVEDTSIATIDDEGTLVGVAEGNTRVFATLGGIQAFPMPVEVVAAPAP